MANQKPWAMSAIVVGVYVCALYGARGTPVVARPPARPVGAAIVRANATPAGALVVCDAGR